MTRYVVLIGVNVNGDRDDSDNPGVHIVTVDATSEEAAGEIVEALKSQNDEVVTRALVYDIDKFATLIEELAADRADYVEAPDGSGKEQQ